jgi:hypothetical protein
MRYAGMAVEKLGLAVPADNSNNIELNLVVDSSRDRDDLKDWFDEVEGRKLIDWGVQKRKMASFGISGRVFP